MTALLYTILALSLVCLALGWRVTRLESFIERLRRAYEYDSAATRDFLLRRTDALPNPDDE